MSQKAFVQTNFAGGNATDLKLGIKNSFATSQSIDFRKKPSQFTILPQTRVDDSSIVNDLIQNMVMTNSGTIYSIGSGGSFYKRTTAGAWSLEANINAGKFGMDYRRDSEAIYICSAKAVSLYAQVDSTSATSVMNPDFYGQSFTTYDNTETAGFNVNPYQVSGGKTSLLHTPAVSGTQDEGPTFRRYFQTDIEPLSKVSVFVTQITGGASASISCTLHDGLDNQLATVTIQNTDVVVNAWNDFIFTNQVRVYVAPNARTYHLHFTCGVDGGARIASTATDDLTTCNLMVYADRLVSTTNGMHPMTRFQQFEVIGNANYLSVWEPLEDPPSNIAWQRHRLTFPMEYEVCGIAVFNEYLAIACERITTNVQTPQDGIIFFWDGLSPTYNYLTKIPEGSPYALHEYKNILYYYAGGSWYAINSPASQPVKIRTMPDTDTEFSGANPSIIVYPYCATVRNGIHMMAFPSTTVNTTIRFGVYSWGAIDKNFPESFGYSYPISTGSQLYTAQNNLTIGMVRSYGTEMYISWRDDTNGGYGIDIVDNTSLPASDAYWESLIFDNSFPGKEKTGAYIQTTFADLPEDCTFILKYSINRGDWIYSDTMTADMLSYPRNARFDIGGQRFYEIQIGIDIQVGTTTPAITQMALIFEDNSRESLIS